MHLSVRICLEYFESVLSFHFSKYNNLVKVVKLYSPVRRLLRVWLGINSKIYVHFLYADVIT